MTIKSLTLSKRLCITSNIIFHQVVAVITAYILTTVFVNEKIDSLATWHMVLAPLGIVLLMLESFILFTKENIYTLYLTRNTRQTIHGILQVLSTVLVTVGCAFRINTKTKHFNTTHGILGLTAWVLIWIGTISGIIAHHSKDLNKIINPSWNKLCHYIIGLAGFIVGVVTLGYGMKEYFKFVSNENVIIAAIVTTAIVSCWSLIDTVKSIYSQICNILGK